MSKLRVVEYDKEKPTVFIDLNETLITSVYERHVRRARLGSPIVRQGILVEDIVHWLRPDAEEFLQTLTAKGYQLFILTNGPHPYQKKVVEALGISKYFLQVLGRKYYDEKKLFYSKNTMPLTKSFVLIDDAALAGDDDRRSIRKLRGLGLSLPIDDEVWSDAHRTLAEKHFVLCEGWTAREPRDIDTDPPSLLPYIAQIDEKLRKQLTNNGGM